MFFFFYSKRIVLLRHSEVENWSVFLADGLKTSRESSSSSKRNSVMGRSRKVSGSLTDEQLGRMLKLTASYLYTKSV